MKEFWDSKYASSTYVYGTQPNEYVKDAISKNILSGRVMFPAEGEGRNAVYAAQQGLQVVAFDQSTEARLKALRLAADKSVEIEYLTGEFTKIPLTGTFDGAVLTYAHFPPHLRAQYHQHVAQYIKSGGVIVLEAFSKAHTKYQQQNPSVGGPQNIDMLYTTEIMLNDFPEFAPLQIEETDVPLSEGIGHNGTASVIRFIGIKK